MQIHYSISKMQRCLFTFVLSVATVVSTIASSKALYPAPLQQNVRVTGLVTAASDQTGLPGVSIVLKGTTTGTVTNAEGRYSLDVPPDGTLVFSFVGFESQEIPVSGRTAIDIVMQETVEALQ